MCKICRANAKVKKMPVETENSLALDWRHYGACAFSRSGTKGYRSIRIDIQGLSELADQNNTVNNRKNLK
jgi:hypothetical protein